MNKRKITLIISGVILLLPWIAAFVFALLGIWTEEIKWAQTSVIFFMAAIITFVPINVLIRSMLDKD